MSDRGDRRLLLSRAGVVLLIVAPILIMFGPLLAGDRSPAMRDAAHFYHPLFQWTTESWRTSGPPLWNPYENTGTPLLADASSSLLYPGCLLFLAPLDFTILFNLYLMAHVVLAALGSYRLARHWQGSRLASCCAAITYSCGGSVVFQHCNIVFLVGAAWLPYAAWAIDALLTAFSWRSALALGIVLALMVLGGDPQMAYHVVLLGGLYAVLSAMRRQEGPTMRLGKRAARGLANLGWIIASAGIGLALSAVQVLPSLEAAVGSERAYFDHPRNIYEAAHVLGQPLADHRSGWTDAATGIFSQPESTTHHDRLYDFSLAPWRLIECVWPNVGGRMFPTHRRWLSLVPAEGRIWTPSLYFGWIALALALGQCRLWRGGASQVWLSWVLLLSLLGSFGWYGLGWCVREFSASVLSGDPEGIRIGSPVGGLYWLMVTLLPGYVSFRYPSKLLVVAALAVTQLAARGFEQAMVPPSPRRLGVIRTVTVASVVMLGICWSGFTWLDQFGQQSAVARRINQFLASQRDPTLGPFDWPGCQRDVCLAFMHTAVIGTVAHWLLGGREYAAWRQWGLAVLIAADVAGANYWLIPTAPADIWRREPAAAVAIHAACAEPVPRVYRASLMRWRPAEFAVAGDSDRLAQLAHWERDTLFPKYGLPFGISLVESYGSLKSADYESLLFVARQNCPPTEPGGKRDLPHPAALHLLGTQYLVVPQHWKRPVWAALLTPPTDAGLPPGTAIWRLNQPLPRAWIVHQVEVLPMLRSRRIADVDERTRDVLFPRTPGSGDRAPRDFMSRAVVESDEPLETFPGPKRTGTDQCRIVESGITAMEIEATLQSPGLVVLSDLYAPGWRCRVKTEETWRTVPILRANRVARGVWLPAGKHQIQMTYQPFSLATGAWISGFGWLVAMIVLVGSVAVPALRAARGGG